MKELVFQVEFLSDIVLPASSNTEGNIEQLDFIPGSNFLGMVARSYGEFENAFDVFHSGAARFGDARPLVDGQASYKMPLSFFHEKLDDSKMVNHHLITNFSEYKQLKQKRKGYITEDLKAFSLHYNYAQKSAYDKENRRSKESAMYGYQSISEGTLWLFSVKCEESISSDVATQIENLLLGNRRLGKSKSAQYGRVNITKSQKLKEVNCKDTKSQIILYAKSRLALVDEEGMPTYDLKYLTEGLTDENIVWEKSQIKTSTFTPYNAAMQTKAYERVVINSGSVIVLQNLSEAQMKSLKKSVGVYLSEGFGEVLINPEFLDIEDKFSFVSEKVKNDDTPKKEVISSVLGNFLANKNNKKIEQIEIAKEVSDFISKNRKLYNKINNSQWGTIRSICSAPGEKFREDIRDYIESGKVTWTTEQVETLLENTKSRAFISMLAMLMPKQKKEN